MTDSTSDGGGSSSEQRTLADEIGEDSSDVVSILGHLYRGEVERTVSWRTRLDQTTNWAVVVMATILTFAFSSQDNPHYMLLIGVLGVFVFLIIESQRYQEYDAWRHRVRILQRGFFAEVTDPGDPSMTDWREQLGEDLRRPSILLPRWKALAHRLKRVYLFLLTVLIAAWLLRITVFESESTWTETAAIADIPGTITVGVVLGLYLVSSVLALWSVHEHRMREFGSEAMSDSE